METIDWHTLILGLLVGDYMVRMWFMMKGRD